MVDEYCGKDVSSKIDPNEISVLLGVLVAYSTSVNILVIYENVLAAYLRKMSHQIM
jgi:hypothetical protein